MNRVEKEMAKKRAEAAKGLSAEEARKMNLLGTLTKEVHFKIFPEEYDHYTKWILFQLLNTAAAARILWRPNIPPRLMHAEKSWTCLSLIQTACPPAI